MKTPKQLRRDIQDLSLHLQQVQGGLQSRATIKVANIGKECLRSANALKQLLESQQVPGEYKVAVVGRFKAGKSSFVNELLNNRLASEGTLPETAAVTTFKYGSNVRANIRFVDQTRWHELKKLHTDDPKHLDVHRVRSWVSFSIPKKNKESEPDTVFDLQGLEREHVREGGHTVTLELPAHSTKKATGDFRRKLKEYTTASSPLHCLVDSIDITAPAEILDQGVLLIDTPGLDDTERFRVTLTERVVADVDAVLFLTKSGASYGQSEKDFLLSLLRKGTVKQLIVVVTQIDETYNKVLAEAEDNDEEPEPIADCIARERIKITREIAETLKDLEQDGSLHRYQEQLGEVPIAFTSARLHRDWKEKKNLPFVITPSDPGGVEQLKADLLKLLSTESRLALTAENIIKGASHQLLELQSVLQNKLQSLQITQNKEVAEQKLKTFHGEFGEARKGFARTVEQQIQLLTERLSEQPQRDEVLLSLIAALAEQPLSAIESDDMGRHWKTRRYGGWGHLSGLQGSTAGLIFPRVQQLLDTRTALFSNYAQRFEEALLRLSKSSEEISERLELGTNVPMDVSGKLKGVLKRSMQNAQEMIAIEERKVQQLLDDFVTDSVADRVSEKRRLVADIWETGTTVRQNEQIKSFYREVKLLLTDALQSYLKESSYRFGEFLLAEAKAAPRDALDSVDVLLEQAADNILAAATLHLSGQTEEATVAISGINNELLATLDRFRTVMPESPTVVEKSITSAQPSSKTPIAAPTKAASDFNVMSDCADWANEVQAAATVCISRLQLQEGSIGWSYEKLFESRFLKGAVQLSLIDPHLSKANQLRNLQEFLMHVAEAAKPKAIEIVTSNLDGEIIAQQNRVLNEVSKDLFQQFGVALTVRRENGLHDRFLRLNHGVLFKLGRGLDVYKPATGLAAHRPASRHVRATEIDVFVTPGHTLI
jgi:GTPase Era involved in 16S rRNA processing